MKTKLIILPMLLSAFNPVVFAMQEEGQALESWSQKRLFQEAVNERDIYTIERTLKDVSLDTIHETIMKLAKEQAPKADSRDEDEIERQKQRMTDTIDIIRMFFARKPDQRPYLEKADEYGMTPLMWAATRGNLAIVKVLLDLGANLNTRSANGATALTYAAIQDHVDVVNLLIARGADVNVRDANGNTPLISTIERINAVKDAAKANSIYAYEHSNAPLNTVKLLIQKGADVNAIDKFGKTALMWAAGNDKVEVDILDALEAAGADLNIVTKDGDSALSIAAHTGSADAVAFLIEAGATGINCPDKYGYTPLFWAVRNQEFRKAKILLEAGANPIPAYNLLMEIAKIKRFDTPVFRPTINLVIKDMSTKPEIFNDLGIKLLVLAASTGNVEIVNALLARNINVNLPTEDGKLALREAVLQGKDDIAKSLLAAGARVPEDLTSESAEIAAALNRVRTSGRLGNESEYNKLWKELREIA